MVALDYRRVTEIVGRHRSYTSSLSPDATMIAGLEQVGLALAGQQKLTDNLTFEFDGNYLRRTVPQCLTVRGCNLPPRQDLHPDCRGHGRAPDRQGSD